MSKKVLLVDDDMAKRVALADSLREEGIEVLEAGDGKTGLNLALNEHPDMILLDITMPVMDGLAMLEKLRQDKWGSGAHVTLFTNSADPNKVAKAMQLGAFNYLLKESFNLEEVIKQIKEKLNLSNQK